MRWIRRRENSGASAVVERPPAVRAEDFTQSTQELHEEIERLAAANRERPDPASQRRLLRLRHVAGIRVLDAPPEHPAHPEP